MDGDEQKLSRALADVVRRPVATLVASWNWKAAAVSALLRAVMFFVANLRAGGQSAVRASLVEAVFAIAAAGLMGAAVQRLRSATPVAATAAVVWLGLPTLLLTAQYGWHRALGTPHVRAGLIASFCFASLASGFNWFAMRRGAMLSGAPGAGARVAADARALPAIVLEFVLAGPRAIWKSTLTRR